ncbi:hypothetical protein QBC46DRAFT_346068 [Diplogelasinospora grovesii]|uniref:Fungal N-terminal domain-containing protein n=1 Tax=Diplogelasinospora grovesii TaxID=303347 RepID=A0AAN6S0I7_9PEZI|nr:hypothetical protein QBC46DRAFT_346068 [Diplogelasinospora grovesii]
MADPIGLTGAIVGLISVGLQIYAGLHEYVNGIRERKIELNRTETLVKQLKAALDLLNQQELETLLKSMPQSTTRSASAGPPYRNIYGLVDGLKAQKEGNIFERGTACSAESLTSLC